MDLRIEQELQTRNGRIVYMIFRPGGRRHYNIRLWLAGLDLQEVDNVSYYLHRTFRVPDRKPKVGAESCEIFFWTWGQFRVRAYVIMKSGKKITLEHDLHYRLPIDNGMNYLFLREAK